MNFLNKQQSNGSLPLSCQSEELPQLPDSLLKEGELCLLKGDSSKGLEYFEEAAKLAPMSSELFFRQGLALLEHGSEEGKQKSLFLASKKFKVATLLKSNFFEAWVAWGNTLHLLGTTYKAHRYFLEAEEKFRKAANLLSDELPDTLADFYWDYGVIWLRIAEQSGEPLDLQLALDAFQKTTSFEQTLPSEFWIDYGQASLKLAVYINDVRLLVKSINCFKHAVSRAMNSYENWISLATALQALYNYTHDEDHFLQANESFSSAAQLKPQDHSLWLKWAQFLGESGKRNRDMKRLRSSIEKAHRAYVCDPKLPTALAIWAEALATIGELSERLDLIFEAQNKIVEAIELTPQSPEIWFSYGVCLNALGHYFNESDYHYQAIEKFQQGISVDRTSDRNWHAIAITYAFIGQKEEDSEAFERAFRFFAKAIELKTSTYYIFDYAVALAKLGELSHEQKWLDESINQFEKALALQKNAIYLHPDWLFHYASTLDMLADFHEEESYYLKAIEILSHVLMIDPDFPHLHHRLALVFSHLGELLTEREQFYRAVHHYRLAAKHEEENDQIILDWGVTLINLAQESRDENEKEQCYKEAEHKITQAAKLGNLTACYHLSCLYSLTHQHEKALHFLEKANIHGSLPPLQEILEDDWLDGLRSTSDFREFLNKLENKPNLHEER